MQDFPFQPLSSVLNVYVDTDWNGEQDTHRSTSGGTVTIGETPVELKHWCVSQPTISLSSGEAETKGVVKGCVEALYISNLLREQGHEVKIVIHCDSSASIGHCSRLGNGKRMRHLERAELWIQQVIRSGRVSLKWISGRLNPADMFTKHVSGHDIQRHMAVLGYKLFARDGSQYGMKDLDAFCNFPEEPSDDAYDSRMTLALEKMSDDVCIGSNVG